MICNAILTKAVYELKHFKSLMKSLFISFLKSNLRSCFFKELKKRRNL
jgi:hypothetical protein